MVPYKNLTVKADFSIEDTLKRICRALAKAPLTCKDTYCGIHKEPRDPRVAAMTLGQEIGQALSSKGGANKAWEILQDTVNLRPYFA